MSDGLALSALDWWQEAGVDILADDGPRDWLQVTSAAVPATPFAAPVPAVPTMPGDLTEFRAWLLADAAVPGLSRTRHDAAGDSASGTMVVVDMPEACDRGTGALLTGEAGALFDRMLGAIGLARDALYLAPFAPARPATGKLDKAACAKLDRLMRHHLALVRPRRLLLLGEAPVCALAGRPVAQARGAAFPVEADGGAIAAIASFHPRTVQAQPDLRRAAWADLQAFQVLA